MIRRGSVSFHAASLLLPRRVRNPVLALYAFCRVADDDVDLTAEKQQAVDKLRQRLTLAYAGRPRNAPADRAFAAIIEQFEMPRELPEALIEGLDWDAQGRRHQTLSDLNAYSARVASAVGAMFCVLMRVRDPDTLARACDLGVAMQLTNIARDVGEDAAEGRLYIPLEWLDEAGLDAEALLANPQPSEAVRHLVRRLLQEATRLYRRSEAGISALPIGCRPGIFASRYIYAGIGGELRRCGYDSINERAHTSTGRKLALIGLSIGRSAGSALMPRSPIIYASPLPETAFLVDAAANQRRSTWSDAITVALSGLAVADRRRAAALEEIL